MLRVKSAAEPSTFDALVRVPGSAFLAKHGVPPKRKLPPKTKIPAYWRKCLPDLHSSYGGICAYAGVYLEKCLGGVTADHFVAKVGALGKTYEWSNYRLACSTLNSRKNKFALALDPFKVRSGEFQLELVTGKIFPALGLKPDRLAKVKSTIKLLKLDDGNFREMRVSRFTDYCNKHVDEFHLKKYSPFIWSEAKRQGLL